MRLEGEGFRFDPPNDQVCQINILYPEKAIKQSKIALVQELSKLEKKVNYREANVPAA